MVPKKYNQQRSAASREAILRATLNIAMERGYDGTPMSEIARASGLPIGSVYWHFEDKEHLFIELLNFCFDKWVETRPPEAVPRNILTKSITKAGQISNSESTPQSVMWALALMFTFEKPSSNTAARKRYMEIRKDMYSFTARRISNRYPHLAEEKAAEVANDVTVMVRALIEGFFVSAAGGDKLDYSRYGRLAADLIEDFEQRRVKEVENDE